jgi:hypothetical protein
MGFKGVEMIIKCNDNFFVQWDVVYPNADGLNLGVFNFWINDVCYPGKSTNLTLTSLFHCLRSNVFAINKAESELGNIPIEEIDFSDVENERLVRLDTDELFQFGFGLIVAFNKHTERLFYTMDYEQTYSEIVLPKGTLMDTLNSLPLSPRSSD